MARPTASISPRWTRKSSRPWPSGWTPPLTFDRLAAGVQVLRANHDTEEGSVLKPGEILRLTERVDLIDKGERFRDELRFVESQLLILSQSEKAGVDAGTPVSTLWPSRGLGIVRSTETNNRRKDFVDRVLFQAVAHHLASTRVGAAAPTLVVAGADSLGRAALEAMARHAVHARVRLVYLFEHLRDDAAELLGGGDSVTLLMRMGNGEEAEKAARFIGRGYTFQLSQLSRQAGTSTNVTTSTGTSTTSGGSETHTVGGGSSSSGSSKSWSDSVTSSWSESWTTGKAFSEGTSESKGATLQRSYEFMVEPTQLQTLEPTTFLLIDSGSQGRRVRMADCYPGGRVRRPGEPHRPDVLRNRTSLT